ncbi:MAG: thioredoxin domain-containing protein [bacterium]|nr:thioredoxin domain-containing protein [bacterium]
MIIEVTKENFDEEVLKSEKPVLVDFWGPQCGPCKALMPTIERIAETFKDFLKVVKIDSSKNRRLCIEFRVLSLPTILFFEGGREISRLSSNQISDKTIITMIKHLLESGKGGKNV